MVTNKLLARLVLVVALLAMSVPMFAHHGSATYDTSKPVLVKDRRLRSSSGRILTPSLCRCQGCQRQRRALGRGGG